MTDEVVPVDASDVVARAAAALRAGRVVVLPTDTVYGVAALPEDAAAMAEVFERKGRAATTPIAVLCADVEQALALAAPAAAARARPAAARHWPGPLTLVLPRRAGLALHLGEPTTTIGLRVPAHPVVQALAALVGPLATTSANRHGEPTPASAAEAARSLGPGLGLVVDGGPLEGSSSTVVDATGEPWRVLREGPVPASDLPLRAEG